MLGFRQRLASFVFPKNSQKGTLGVIWSNEERIKMVLESANPLECVGSIFSLKKFTDLLEVLGKDWFREPVLHLWNNFTFFEKHRNEPLRRSARKKVKVADCSEQQYDMQQDLFETDDNSQLDDSPVDFQKTTKGLTDKASQTNDLSNTLEVKLKRLKHSVKELIESYSKNMQSNFTDQVISSNELCNHYAGLPSVDVLNAVFEYLDPGINSENVILYNY